MQRSDPYRRLVFDLWVLLESSAPDHGELGEHVVTAVDALLASIAAVAQVDERIVLEVRDGALFVQDVRVGVDLRSFAGVESLVGLFDRRRVGGLILERGVEGRELVRVARALARADAVDGESAPWSTEQLARDGVTGVRCLPAGAAAHLGSIETDDRGRLPVGVGPDTGLDAVLIVQRLVGEIGPADVVSAPLARGIVKALVDAVLDDGVMLGLLGRMQEASESLRQRRSLVAVYSVLLARALGMPVDLVVQAGVAALLGGVARTREAMLVRLGAVSDLAMRTLVVVRHLDDRVTDDDYASLAASDAIGGMTPAVVRVCEAFEQRRWTPAGGIDSALGFAELERLATAGAVPRRFVAAFRDAHDAVRGLDVASTPS